MLKIPDTDEAAESGHELTFGERTVSNGAWGRDRF